MLKNYAQQIKAMAKGGFGKDVFSDIALPRKKRSDKGTHGQRKEYERKENAFRLILFQHLRNKGCHVYRLENSICGRNNRSIPDAWVFCLHTGWSGWLELKSDIGRLTGEQPLFKERCLLTGVNHLVVRTIEDTAPIFKSPSREKQLGTIDFPDVK